MNDLAEKALHGLDAARREVCARPMSSFAALGLALSSVVMVFGARVGAARPTRPLTTWFGLEETHGAGPSDPVPAAIMLAALVALLLTWIAVVELVHRTRQPARRVWWVAAAWAAPFAVGPPLMDTTAYSYAAFGLLQRNGHSPYASGPNRLGDVPVVSAIAPGARGTPSGSGPLGTLVQHLAVSVGAGSALAAVIILRLLAVFVAIAIGRLAADLAGRRRARALSLVVLNPLVLLYVVSAVHLDGLLVMFVLAAALAAGRRRWVAAVVFAALAGCVSGQGFVALLGVVAAHLLGRRGRPVWRLLGQDALAAGVPIGVIGIAASDGFGWLHTITKQFTADTPFSVAGATAKLLGPIVRGASHDDLVDGARITALIAMVCVLGYLTATVRQRGL
ncbi:MAG TPA: hypothetical protein VFL65_04525, partial [Jatrophihabitans sp.]|nr:hypothetical protein [Jatrophihabitans sp.]